MTDTNRHPHRSHSLAHAFWEHRWYLLTGEIWGRPDLKPLAYPR